RRRDSRTVMRRGTSRPRRVKERRWGTSWPRQLVRSCLYYAHCPWFADQFPPQLLLPWTDAAQRPARFGDPYDPCHLVLSVPVGLDLHPVLASAGIHSLVTRYHREVR